jgi:Fe-Mn family superoxide dismutase
MNLNSNLQMIGLESLPYSKDLLKPTLSVETLDFHYDKHHKGYVDKLNQLIKDTDLENKSLREIVLTSHKEKNLGVYNNSAQIWNHDFYWKSLDSRGSREPDANLLPLLKNEFGEMENFNNKFLEAGLGLFGSGWIWLVQDPKTLKLSIMQTRNADSPLIFDQIPLITIDVWEHAYYLKHKNKRASYIEAWWNVVNWPFVEENYTKATL